uniref:DASH complex subunit ASK1 n=1 Tax=Blastobotrys adeninivorans TaxID=409370 RepID=A0A060T1D8_BLAAD
MSQRLSIRPPTASSRQSMAPTAPRTDQKTAIISELAETEQSITLTLQKIDQNFARANKLVGEHVLPAIEKYAAQSREVWGGAKFWKQFLEASANVEVAGIEEDIYPGEQADANNADEQETSVHEPEYDAYDYHDTPSKIQPTMESTPNRSINKSPTKIPRPVRTPSRTTPRRESPSGTPGDVSVKSEDMDISMDMGNLDLTNRHVFQPKQASNAHFGSELDDDSDLSRDIPPPRLSIAFNDSPAKPIKSPVRHQTMNKVWRVQATPLRAQQRQTSSRPGNQSATKPMSGSLAGMLDDLDSPDIKPPKLKSRLFDEPESPTTDNDVSMTNATPARPAPTNRFKTPQRKYYDDSDSDVDMLPQGMSPPVTMHFKTPAKESARILVDDILRKVGGDDSGSVSVPTFKAEDETTGKNMFKDFLNSDHFTSNSNI